MARSIGLLLSGQPFRGVGGTDAIPLSVSARLDEWRRLRAARPAGRRLLGAACDADLASADRMLVQSVRDGERKRGRPPWRGRFNRAGRWRARAAAVGARTCGYSRAQRGAGPTTASIDTP